ncbi:MAG: hypothetical protein BWY85_02071 [Firmicutes bacterium ADurb.Bin506]|nr:MAG: hypothetical protein BWY85_02071 [Firmicutes bacterium ADurb.Bin506]
MSLSLTQILFSTISFVISLPFTSYTSVGSDLRAATSTSSMLGAFLR